MHAGMNWDDLCHLWAFNKRDRKMHVSEEKQVYVDINSISGRRFVDIFWLFKRLNTSVSFTCKNYVKDECPFELV